MQKRNEDAREAARTPALTGTLGGPSYREQGEIEGWALQWDASALRKATLARTMRQLREASGNA